MLFIVAVAVFSFIAILPPPIHPFTRGLDRVLDRFIVAYSTDKTAGVLSLSKAVSAHV